MTKIDNLAFILYSHSSLKWIWNAFTGEAEKYFPIDCNKYFFGDIEFENNVNYKNIIYKNNIHRGLGGAIVAGINASNFEYICIFMADMSDSVEDLKKYYSLIQLKKLDAVFGSRFIKGSRIINYPKSKLILNRIFNYIVKVLFLSNYNDFTNAFKIYKKDTLLKLFPIVSENFNVFLELPLKIISRRYSYEIVSISWTNRKKGLSKFNIKELTSKYIFTLIYCFLEKILLKKKNSN